jgi:hypothetical protein
MSYAANQYTLGTATATKIVPPGATVQEVHMHCETKQGTPTVYIGDPTVTSTTGMHIASGDYLTVHLPAGDDLWAIADVANAVIGVLRIPA